MYKLISVISILIRQLYIPNPFEALGTGITIEIGNMPKLLSPELIN